MKWIIRILGGLLVLVLVLGIIFISGPRPSEPTLSVIKKEIPSDFQALEAYIASQESQFPLLKPDNAAHIVWADSVPTKTRYSFLYLHGFGASYGEGAPAHQHIADQFHGNIYMARLADHGQDEKDQNLCDMTVQSYLQSAEDAYQIASKIGDSVVILATSGGGALGLYLASKHPDIKALVTYSPAVKVFDDNAKLLTGPWGAQLAKMVTGNESNQWKYKKPEMAKYWSNPQCWDAVIQFCLFQEKVMIPETFTAVHCPFFMGYYYENEEKQDKVVSVAAMKTMFTQLGTPAEMKVEKAFPKAGNHVILSNIMSDDWENVQASTLRFLENTAHLKTEK